MPSSYEKGRSSEYYVKQLLKSMGYKWIIHSTGSHSPIIVLLTTFDSNKTYLFTTKLLSISLNNFSVASLLNYLLR